VTSSLDQKPTPPDAAAVPGIIAPSVTSSPDLDASAWDWVDASVTAPDAATPGPVETDPVKQAAVPDTLGGDGECLQDDEGYAEPPDLCEWIAVGDATVVAVIEGLEHLDEPGWGFPPDAPDGRLLSSEECRPSTRAFEIDIRVEHTWFGQPPETVRVRVGSGQMDYFIPHPSSVDPETGELSWFPAPRESRPHQGPLRIGQRIVLGISRVEVEHEGETTEYWSLMGNTILGTDEDERIYVYQRREDCDFNLTPARLDRVTVSEALELIQDCSDELLQSGRELGERVREVWGTPRNAVAALCSFVGPRAEDLADSTPASDPNVVGWGIHIDPVTGLEAKLTEQRIDVNTGESTLIRLKAADP
jgi:hypothetical protein